ncbi:MAG: hypothetical protein JW844_07750 [Candidatus Omnitrophica bacterium]|nr:hypothetical protein [Candidatus Omnitrophota bacterium]
MKKTGYMPRLLLSLIMVAACVAPPAWAGSMKEKIQERISKSNIQYQGILDEQGDRSVVVGDGQMTMPQCCVYAAVEHSNEQAPADAAPVLSAYAIYQTDYKAELDENVVTVTGRALFEVFRKGWTQLPLAKSSVGLIDVSVNKGTAFVVTQGGRYYLMVEKPGRYTLDIEFLIKATRERENGPGDFTFDVIPAPISQFEFTMPESGVEIFIEPAIKVEVKEKDGETAAWAIMPNTATITTRWTKALPKEKITPVTLEPKVYLDTATCASIGEGILKCQTRLNYSILQSEVSTFRISVPEDVTLLHVSGRDLRDWKVCGDDGARYLDVYLNYGIKGSYVLDVTYERNIGEGSAVAEMPVLKALGVERENGYFGIAARTNVELAADKLERVTPIDVKELPSSVWNQSANPILLAFKYLNHPFSITINVTKHEEIPVLVAAVDVGDYSTLYTEEGKVLTRATYHVRNNVKQFLRFALPEEATLWSVFVADKPVKPAKDKNGSILIPLEKSQLQGETLTRFPVEIVYLERTSAMNPIIGRLRMELPQIDIPISEMYWTVALPYRYSYFKFGGDVSPTKYPSRSVLAVSQRVVLGEKAIYDRDQYTSQCAPKQMQQVDGGWSTHVKGALPIKIAIPQQGRKLYFSKLLVTEQESSWLTMHYTSVLQKVRRPLKWVLIIILALFFVGKIVKKIRRKKGTAVGK